MLYEKEGSMLHRRILVRHFDLGIIIAFFYYFC